MKDLIKKILNESDDFGWVDDVNPLSKTEIVNKLKVLSEFGYHSSEKSRLVNSLYLLGLNQQQLDNFVNSLHDFSYLIHNSGQDVGSQDGYGEGYNQGYGEGLSDTSAEMERAGRNKCDEGYDEGSRDGHERGYEEGVEEYYHKAFEEGRVYQYGLDTEKFERSQSSFDPTEYDEEYSDY